MLVIKKVVEVGRTVTAPRVWLVGGHVGGMGGGILLAGVAGTAEAELAARVLP